MLIEKTKNPNNRGYTYYCMCDNCGKEFKRKASWVKNTKTQFCDRKCQSIFQKTLRGEKANGWKGGRISTHSDGYVRILKPDHPHCDPVGYVYEHRFVMEKHLGRYLNTNEEIHHIDGNKSNNVINNLELTSKSRHSKKTTQKIKRNSRGIFVKSS